MGAFLKFNQHSKWHLEIYCCLFFSRFNYQNNVAAVVSQVCCENKAMFFNLFSERSSTLMMPSSPPFCRRFASEGGEWSLCSSSTVYL